MWSAPHWPQTGAKFLLTPEPRCSQLCPVGGRPASPRPDGLAGGKRVGRRPGEAEYSQAPESGEPWLRPAAGRSDRVCRENLRRAWRQIRTGGISRACRYPFRPRFGFGILAKNGPENGSAPSLFFTGPCLAFCQPRLFSDIHRPAKCGVCCRNWPGCKVEEASPKSAGNSFVEIRLPSPPSVARERRCPGRDPRRQCPPDAREIGAMGAPNGGLAGPGTPRKAGGRALGLVA